MILTRPPKLALVHRHGATRNRLILLCEWHVCLAISSKVIILAWSTAELLLSLGWRGGGAVGPLPSLHSCGSRCMIGLVLLSLLNLMVQHFWCRPIWCLMGGIEASISSASIGVVQKAAHISLSARLWTFLRGLIWYWRPVHQTGHAYRILANLKGSLVRPTTYWSPLGLAQQEPYYSLRLPYRYSDQMPDSPDPTGTTWHNTLQ